MSDMFKRDREALFSSNDEPDFDADLDDDEAALDKMDFTSGGPTMEEDMFTVTDPREEPDGKAEAFDDLL